MTSRSSARNALSACTTESRPNASETAAFWPPRLPSYSLRVKSRAVPHRTTVLKSGSII